MKRIYIALGCLFVFTCGLLIVKSTFESKQKQLLYDKETLFNQEDSRKMAEYIKTLAEARLGKNSEEIVSLATKLLNEDTNDRFIKKYNDYLKKLKDESDYIIIDKQYTDAQQNFNTVFETLKSDGYLTESGDLTEKALTKGSQQVGDSSTSDTTGSLEADTTVYGAGTDFSDMPATKDGLMNYVDLHTMYVGDGEEIVEMNENKKLPFMLLGYTSIYSDNTVEAITRADFDNATYEDMEYRAKSIISLSNYDLAEYTRQSDSFDTRTDEEKQADMEKSLEAYNNYLAYAEKQNYIDEGDGESESITDSMGSSLYTYNFKNPETSNLVKVNEQGQHVVYWADILDSVGKTLTIKLFEQDYSFDLTNYRAPMSLYANTEYSLDSYEYFVEPLSKTGFIGRLHVQFSSKDKRDFVLKTEIQIDTLGKVWLSDEQIDAILTE